MLTTSELDEIQETLRQVLATQDERHWFQQVYSGPAFMEALSDRSGPADSVEQIAAAAIQVCLAREWTDDPCWLQQLLTRLRTFGGQGGIRTISHVDAIIDRLQRRINVLDEVWSVPWVQNGLPFVDRDGLRQALREDLSRSGGRPILRIEGDAVSGKSYSHELMDHVSEARGWPFRVIRFEVEEGSESEWNALVLAQNVVGEMGCKMNDAPLLDPKLLGIPSLCTWVLQSAKSSRQQWWLFLDSFGRLRKDNTARSLIQALADKIANSSNRQFLRLILIAYDESLAKVEEERIAYDRVATRLSETMAFLTVRDCLAKVYPQSHPAPDKLDALAAAVLKDLPPDVPWIKSVNTRVKAAAKGIRNGS